VLASIITDSVKRNTTAVGDLATTEPSTGVDSTSDEWAATRVAGRTKNSDKPHSAALDHRLIRSQPAQPTDVVVATVLDVEGPGTPGVSVPSAPTLTVAKAQLLHPPPGFCTTVVNFPE